MLRSNAELEQALAAAGETEVLLRAEVARLAAALRAAQGGGRRRCRRRCSRCLRRLRRLRLLHRLRRLLCRPARAGRRPSLIDLLVAPGCQPGDNRPTGACGFKTGVQRSVTPAQQGYYDPVQSPFSAPLVGCARRRAVCCVGCTRVCQVDGSLGGPKWAVCCLRTRPRRPRARARLCQRRRPLARRDPEGAQKRRVNDDCVEPVYHNESVDTSTAVRLSQLRSSNQVLQQRFAALLIACACTMAQRRAAVFLGGQPRALAHVAMI